MCNGPAWAGTLVFTRYTNYTGISSDFDSYLYLIEWPFAEQNTDTRCSVGNLDGFTLKYPQRYRCFFKLASNSHAWSYSPRFNNNTTQILGLETVICSDFCAGDPAISAGPGFASDPNTHILGGGIVTPKLYISHTWTAWADNSNADILRKNNKLNYLWAGSVSGNDNMVDFAFRDSYVDDNPFDVFIASAAPDASANQGSKPGCYNLQYYYDKTNDRVLKWGGTELGWNYKNSIEFRWKWNHQKIYTNDWVKCTQEYYNDIYKIPFYKYEGMPICRTLNKTGKIKFKLRFTNKKISDGSNLTPTSTENWYTYVITDKKFKNGNMPTIDSTDSYWKDTDGYSHVLMREERKTGNYQYTTEWLEFDKSKIMDTDNGDYIYIKVSPNDDDQVVSVEVVDIISYTED